MKFGTERRKKVVPGAAVTLEGERERGMPKYNSGHWTLDTSNPPKTG